MAEEIRVLRISTGSSGHSPGEKIVARPACTRVNRPETGA